MNIMAVQFKVILMDGDDAANARLIRFFKINLSALNPAHIFDWVVAYPEERGEFNEQKIFTFPALVGPNIRLTGINDVCGHLSGLIAPAAQPRGSMSHMTSGRSSVPAATLDLENYQRMQAMDAYMTKGQRDEEEKKDDGLDSAQRAAMAARRASLGQHASGSRIGMADAGDMQPPVPANPTAAAYAEQLANQYGQPSAAPIQQYGGNPMPREDNIRVDIPAGFDEAEAALMASYQ